MNVVNRKISEIKPYEKNAKIHDEKQIANVAESIKQFGFVQPAVIDKDGVIVIGHCRVLAAKKLKMEEVPCVCVDELTEEQVKALRIVDNKTNESPWDWQSLMIDVGEIVLNDFDLGVVSEQPMAAERIYDFFDDSGAEVTEKKKKIVKCPHCGTDIEI